MTIRAALQVVRAVAARPSLWATALRQWWRSIPSGWWRRPPFLPVPRADYVHFRMVTMYGDTAPGESHHMAPADVLNYLVWCKRQGRIG